MITVNDHLFIKKTMKVAESEWYSANTEVRTQHFANNFHEISALVNCFVQRQTSLALTSKPYICRLFLFFLPPKFVYISVSPNCS